LAYFFSKILQAALIAVVIVYPIYIDLMASTARHLSTSVNTLPGIYAGAMAWSVKIKLSRWFQLTSFISQRKPFQL
jgi:hypothetical protein